MSMPEVMAEAISKSNQALAETLANAFSNLRYQRAPTVKLAKFCGPPRKSGDPSLKEWLDDLETYAKQLSLNDEQKVAAAMDHLTGAAREEAIWISYLHHVVNEHEWIVTNGLTSGTCNHGELSGEERKRPWLEKDSPEHQALRKLVFDVYLMKNIHYYRNFRHTGFVESFHNHLLMYCDVSCQLSCIRLVWLVACRPDGVLSLQWWATAPGYPLSWFRQESLGLLPGTKSSFQPCSKVVVAQWFALDPVSKHLLGLPLQACCQEKCFLCRGPRVDRCARLKLLNSTEVSLLVDPTAATNVTCRASSPASGWFETQLTNQKQGFLICKVWVTHSVLVYLKHTVGDLIPIPSQYAPKRHAYGIIGYKTRNILAAIDCNNHRDRPQQVGPNGKPTYERKYSKRSKKWTAQPKLAPKAYAYIPDLMENIFMKRITTFGHLSQHVSMSADDPRRIAKTIAANRAPSIEKLVEERMERMQKN
ncbi:uncharacterized protein LOC119733083 [Patiria miniata]|uniref:Uncharacterized protein n=1 Tax=Patiria miniata TaxID=46514 RepID=A0A914AGE9_PATMI|nr:uncharacterized protein LOC119733083 [Patiria miniata]